jgi:methyltransferase (TIGR00027 family)
MAKQTVSRTALGAGVCRLIEQYQPEETRLFNDPIVKDLVGATIRWMMQLAVMRNFTMQQTDAVAKGIFGAQICRTRYIDDAAQAALAQGFTQVVILGAGFDTRPYRLPGMERVRTFEVDLPAVQNDKKSKLQKSLGKLPERVTFIPIDFDTQTLDAVLSGTGFDPSKPAVFLWEGVTQYITEAAVRQTLAFIGKSAPGSILLFTYVLKSIIERRSDIPDANRMMDTVAKNSPWIFGLEPAEIPAFLKPFHLALIADVGNVDYQKKYLQPIGRKLVVSEAERIVQARVESQ